MKCNNAFEQTQIEISDTRTMYLSICANCQETDHAKQNDNESKRITCANNEQTDAMYTGKYCYCALYIMTAIDKNT